MRVPGIGSGSDYAEAAARALLELPGLSAMSIGGFEGGEGWREGGRGPDRGRGGCGGGGCWNKEEVGLGKRGLD
jgi:hypothetical protein